MRRLFVLLFLTLTAFQLAFAGMPVASAASAAVPAGSVMVAADAVARAADHCVSHRNAADPAQELPCNTPLDCSVCGVCQVCQWGQQAALSDGHAGAVPVPSARWVFPRDNASYLSAECAPSFKPPIL